MITINGKTINMSGDNIIISNGKVLIDGKDVTPDAKKIDIKVTGNIETLDVDTCDRIHIEGEVYTVKTMSGEVVCGDIKGDVKTMSGDVSADVITGKVKTMSGDIRHGRR